MLSLDYQLGFTVSSRRQTVFYALDILRQYLIIETRTVSKNELVKRILLTTNIVISKYGLFRVIFLFQSKYRQKTELIYARSKDVASTQALFRCAKVIANIFFMNSILGTIIE
jgi:hypothetical protein